MSSTSSTKVRFPDNPEHLQEVRWWRAETRQHLHQRQLVGEP
jgi:hypothetical protein